MGNFLTWQKLGESPQKYAKFSCAFAAAHTHLSPALV
jgi:hypothetical protein